MRLPPAQLPTLLAALGLTLLFALEGVAPAAGGRRQHLRHTLRNLALGGIGSVVVKALLGGTLAAVMVWAENRSFGLLRMVSLPPLVATAAAIVLFDAWMYFWHRANHECNFLWRFHRVHHSDSEMDASTAIRFHAGELLLSTILRLAVIPLLGISVGQLLLYETLLLPVILFHHSNVRLPESWDRALRWLIVTPELHRVHHSPQQPETDSNYASIFSVWDRVAGTFRLRQEGKIVGFGLDEFRDVVWQRFPKLWVIPFVSLPDRIPLFKRFSHLLQR